MKVYQIEICANFSDGRIIRNQTFQIYKDIEKAEKRRKTIKKKLKKRKEITRYYTRIKELYLI